MRGKRFSGVLVAVLVVVLACSGMAETSSPMKSSGVLYFCDMGPSIDDSMLYVSFMKYTEESYRLLETRELESHEYTVVDAPYGIIGLDIRLDQSLIDMDYDFAQYHIEGLTGEAGVDLRSFSTRADAMQFVPTPIYLYRIKPNGLPRDHVRSIQSSIRDPYRSTYNTGYIMPVVSLHFTETGGMEHGLNDEDTVYLVGGDRVRFFMNSWDVALANYDVEKSLKSLKIGESTTLPMKGWGDDAVEGVTLTVTKVATIRGGNAEAERAAEKTKTQQLNDLIHSIVQGNK